MLGASQRISRRASPPVSEVIFPLMHKLTSSRSVRALRLGALCLLLLCLVLTTSIVLVLSALYMDLPDRARLGLYGLLTSFCIFLLYKFFAHSAYCPLCRGPVLRGSRAQRNRHAGRTFWSYRLRIARDILLTNTFNCSYCGERTHCVVKPRPREEGPPPKP